MTITKASLIAAAISITQPAAAQSMLGLGDKNPLAGFGGGVAKESTQKAHMAMHEIGNAARLGQLIKHTESWVLQLMTMAGPIAAGDVSQFQWMLDELRRARMDMEGIVYDPAGHGSYERYQAFLEMQRKRAALRLKSVAAALANLEARADNIGAKTSQLMAANSSAIGGVQVQQIGNEAAGIEIDVQRQQLVLMSDMLRAQTEAEARELENQLLAEERWCALIPDLESCGG